MEKGHVCEVWYVMMIVYTYFYLCNVYRELNLESYIRLALSGGCCISIVRTGLTPLEILKTRLQARPDLYPGFISGIKRIKQEGGR